MNIKKIFSLFALSLFVFVISANRTYASCPARYNGGCQGGCEYVGQCVDNVTCTEQGYYGYLVLARSSEPCGSALIGGIAPPEGIARFNGQAILGGGGSTNSIGIFYFITLGLRLFFIISGLLIFGNFLYSGYIYIVQAGDTKAHGEVKDRLTYSAIGLVVMVSAFILAGLVGAIVFGDPGFILKPEITQYGATSR